MEGPGVHHGSVAGTGVVEQLWIEARPMLASGPPQPLVAPSGEAWSFEVKWDGVRALARLGPDGSIALRSRNGVDLTGRFPAIAGVGAALPTAGAPAILDGECVALDGSGRPTFDGLHRGGAVRFMVFDVLAWHGCDVRSESLDERRALLAGLDLPWLTQEVWAPSAVFDDGDALLAATLEQGMEGVMAKRRDSPYRCGVRSPDWVKLPHRSLTDLVVVGWVRDRSGGGVAALAVADPAGGLLGTVGSGMTQRMSAALLDVLEGIGVAGPDPALDLGEVAAALTHRVGDRLAWVQPLLVAEVRHLGRTESGSLRQPTLVRMRPDLSPADLPRSSW